MSPPVPHTLASSLTLLRDPLALCPCIQRLTDQLTSAISSHLCLPSVPMSPTHAVQGVSGARAALAASTSSQAVAGEGIDIWQEGMNPLCQAGREPCITVPHQW